MLELDGVCKRYGETVAVDGLSLEVRKGEVLGLLGPNGAGKTTTVHVMVGLLEPDQGTIRLAGRGSPSEAAVRRSIGVATQALSLYEDLSGEENLTFFGRIQGLSGARLKERTREALDFVGLEDRRKGPVGTYSGGMKRRLNLAVALVHDPEVLLLDEPTAGVDPQSRNSILEKIHALRDAGKTVVYTTHYMEEAQKLCDRVAILDHGRLLALDSVARLLERHGGDSRLIAETEGGEVRVETRQPIEALRELDAKVPVRSFRMEGPDLESVFLNLTGRSLRD